MSTCQQSTLAEVAFRESMGYSVARLLPGVSSHNNVANRFLDVPEPLRNQWFTQVVDSRVSPVAIEFKTQGKLFVLVGLDWAGTQLLIDWLEFMGHKEPLPQLQTEGAGFMVFSIQGARGDRYVLPTQAMLVAGALSRMDGDGPPARALVIAARPDAGAFSMFFQTLGLLRYAESAGLVPLVYFNRHVCYWSNAGHRGSRNAWEYFFLPVSQLTLDDLGVDANDVEDLDATQLQSHLGNRAIVRNDYLEVDIGCAGWINERQRLIAADLIDRYVRIRPELTAQIEDFYQRRLAGQFVVGVHHRGTDKVVEAAPVPFERYQCALDGFLAEHPHVHIFAATDCAEFLDRLTVRYGDRISSTSAHRSSNGQPVHWGNPQSGAEAIVDAVLLSRSNHFFHGISNVSAAVLVFNRTLAHTNLALA
jgi:hypothetical protein